MAYYSTIKKNKIWKQPKCPSTDEWTKKMCLIYVYMIFQILFPYSLLQNTEWSSLCSTVGPCWFSILYTVVCIC